MICDSAKAERQGKSTHINIKCILATPQERKFPSCGTWLSNLLYMLSDVPDASWWQADHKCLEEDEATKKLWIQYAALCRKGRPFVLFPEVNYET
jgi:hypothetical protein